MSAPAWLVEAHKHLNQREVPGPGSSAWIKSLWAGLKAGPWYWTTFGSDDSKLPWCGAFIAGCLQRVDLPYADRYASAKAWLDYGIKLAGPAIGAIAVKGRAGGGHVFFVLGVTPAGRIIGIGGNQGDAVSINTFDPADILGYRYPPGQVFTGEHLPIMAFKGNATTKES